MPLISRFLGISIYMYFNDHAPPHFHAYYGEYDVQVDINTFKILVGYMPPRALGLVVEWASLNKAALLENWERGENSEPFLPIDPLM